MKAWDRSEAVIAQKLFKRQLDGFFRKKILIQDGELGIVERRGEVVGRLGPGEHAVSSVFDKSMTEIVMIDNSVKEMRRELKELVTRDDRKVAADVELKLRVSDPEKLASSLVGRRSILLTDDLWSRMRDDFVLRVMEPEVKKLREHDLYGNRALLDKLRRTAQEQMRGVLSELGMDVVSLYVEWKHPEEYEGKLAERAEAEGRHEKELDEAEKERELERVKPLPETREKVKAELERERLRRGFELEMEKKETQEDMEEAMEALELKDIKDKERLLLEASRRGLKLPRMPEENVGDLEGRKKDLEELKAITEKNFYKKRINENTFKRIVQEYEKEIAELEVKIKSMKAKK